MATDRVFPDTNVLLSGLVFSGNESKLLELAVAGEIRLVISDVVLAEARAVLREKFPKHEGVLDEFLRLVEYESVPAPDVVAVDKAKSVLRDPNDAPILASILLSAPDVALTGDKDLLTGEVRAFFPILTCSEYLNG